MYVCIIVLLVKHTLGPYVSLSPSLWTGSTVEDGAKNDSGKKDDRRERLGGGVRKRMGEIPIPPSATTLPAAGEAPSAGACSQAHQEETPL